jgi:predicted acylesterase/phospholipase RssA
MKIGVALSGGGFRAIAFHLGVLKRLEETDILRRAVVMSTVSGGAIVGALYALRCAEIGNGAIGSYPVEKLISELRPLLTSNLRGQALYGTPWRGIRTVASFVVPRFRRMPLIEAELDRQVFEGAMLAQMPAWIVINATSLRTGKAWKFFADRMGDYLVGVSSRTEKVRLATAVAASAAFPGLVDAMPLVVNWEDLRPENLDHRWERPPGGSDEFSSWRRSYGHNHGRTVIGLVDGGVYDNEGLNSLRSSKLDVAIISSATPDQADFLGRALVGQLGRLVSVMHSRLGSVTRQHAHEMTHGMHPSEVRDSLLSFSNELKAAVSGGECDNSLLLWADRCSRLADVGWPPRGPQFKRIAQVILSRSLVPDGRQGYPGDEFDIGVKDHGLAAEIVQTLVHYRTDLDAMTNEEVDLLTVQGYFAADVILKSNLPTLEFGSDVVNLRRERPLWSWAHRVVERANADADAVALRIARSSRRTMLGRSRDGRASIRLVPGVVAGILLGVAMLWGGISLIAYVHYLITSWLY